MLGLLDNVRGPLFPEILSDMHLNGVWGATFFATTNLFAFVGSWSTHRVAHQRSSLFLLNVSCLGLALGFAAIATCHQLPLLLTACAFFGYAYGGLNLAENLIVSEAAPKHLRRRIFAGLHSMYGLAALLAPITASAARWMGLSWRQCFYCLAVLPLLILALGLRQKATRPKAEDAGIAMNRGEWIRCVIFSAMMAGYLWGEVSVSTRLVLWLRSERAFTPDMADFYLAGFFIALLGGRVLFSFVHFARFDNWTILWGSSGLAAVTYFLGLHHSPAWFVVTGLCMAPFFPIAMEQVAASFGRASGHALGFVIGCGSLSMVPMHLVIGYFTDTVGLTRALLVGPFTLACIFLGLTTLRLSLQRQQMAALKSL